MRYRPIEIEEFFTEKDADREIIDLMENNGAHLKVVYLKKNERIEAHMSHAETCVYLIDGEIELTFYHEDNCACQSCSCDVTQNIDMDGKRFRVKKEEIFFFEKDVVHSVKAMKDSKFLLIKI